MTPEELSETWKRYSPRLLLIARAIGEPSEDAVQEAFLKLAKQPHPPDDVFAWLVRVTRNQLLQWRRSRWRRLHREQTVAAGSWFRDDIHLLETHLDAEQVTATLRSLTDDQREVIVMHLWGELSFDQIAEATGKSRSSAHRLFQSAIAEMKRRFHPTNQESIA